jgi:hypothetical protein
MRSPAQRKLLEYRLQGSIYIIRLRGGKGGRAVGKEGGQEGGREGGREGGKGESQVGVLGVTTLYVE